MTATLAPPVNAALKLPLLQLAAALDRGQMYNPTSGAQYSERMRTAVRKIEELVACAPPLNSAATTASKPFCAPR